MEAGSRQDYFRQRLRLSEERFRALVRASDAIVWTTAPNGRAAVLDRWFETTGQREEEATGLGWLRAVHPDDREETARVWLAAVAQETLYETRYRLKIRGDGYRWFHARGAPVLDEGGHVQEWIGWCEDIHERIEAERERDRFVELGADLTTVVGPDGRLRRLGPQWTETLGWSEADLTSSPMLEFVHPRDRERTRTAFLPDGPANRVRTLESRWRTQDGGYRWLAWRLRAHPDESVVYGAATDVTERKEAEEALRENEDHLRFMIEISPQMPWIAEPSGRLVSFSERWMETTGLRAREAASRWLTYIHPDDRLRVRKSWENAIRSGKPFNEEHRLRMAGGEYKWVRSRAVPRRDDEGRIVRWYGSAEDISLQKRFASEMEELVQERTAALVRLNEELLAARDEALAGAKAKGEFLANVSHEIRTPMNGVLGTLSVLRERVVDPEKARLVETISASAESLMRILDDLIDLSNLEGGRLAMDPKAVELGELFEDVASLFRNRPQGERVAFRTVPCPRPLRAVVDAARLRQVLVHLVANALKFTHRGAVEFRWEWREDGPDEVKAVFTVRDTGIGIPEPRLESIFEPFTQGDSSAHRRYGGTGLGLSLSRRFVQLMGGTLNVKSRFGRGSTFTVDLPLRRPTDVLPPSRREGGCDSGRELKVLLVEDNPVNVQVAAALIGRCGCRVEVAANGQEAVAMFERNGFDLVFMDLQMPVMDGWQAAREIRSRERTRENPPVPIYALTANSTPRDRAASQDAGMDGLIPKPVRFAAIEEVIESVREVAG